MSFLTYRLTEGRALHTIEKWMLRRDMVGLIAVICIAMAITHIAFENGIGFLYTYEPEIDVKAVNSPMIDWSNYFNELEKDIIKPRAYYLFSEHHLGNLNLYPVIAFLLKNPISLFPLLLAAFLIGAKKEGKHSGLFLLIQALSAYVLLLISPFRTGYGDFLPVLPLIMILAAKAIHSNLGRISKAVLIILLLTYSIESINAWPNQSTYVNSATKYLFSGDMAFSDPADTRENNIHKLSQIRETKVLSGCGFSYGKLAIYKSQFTDIWEPVRGKCLDWLRLHHKKDSELDGWKIYKVNKPDSEISVDAILKSVSQKTLSKSGKGKKLLLIEYRVEGECVGLEAYIGGRFAKRDLRSGHVSGDYVASIPLGDHIIEGTPFELRLEPIENECPGPYIKRLIMIDVDG
jgi:hypothetical protein